MSNMAIDGIVVKIIREAISNMPLHIINTDDGKLYSHEDLYHSFTQSDLYKNLTAIMTSKNMAEKSRGLIEKKAWEYFQYAMFSHRWEEKEPAYAELKESIYIIKNSSKGMVKLRQFCLVAKSCGFHWAWSDTCCIDKANNTELSESIISMFLWYRNSALTIVYLWDVRTNSHDAMEKSIWFKRGWTLQELLAPPVIQLYKQDWTPFGKGGRDEEGELFNHKTDPELLKSLSRASGIAAGRLQNFAPGIGSARERLMWSSARGVHKKEDEAYSMVGIHQLNIYIQYGEKEAAFHRMQQKLLETSKKLDLLDWVGEPHANATYLAPSPQCFKEPTWTPPQEDVDPVIEAMMKRPHIRQWVSTLITRFFCNASIPYHTFEHGYMRVSCFVYPVKNLSRLSKSEGLYEYGIRAHGLEPITISTTKDLAEVAEGKKSSWISWPGGQKEPEYVIVRMWDRDLASRRRTPNALAQAGRADQDPTEAVSAFLRRLREPFIAYLLIKEDDEYRRVGTARRIVTRLGGMPLCPVVQMLSLK